MTIRGFELEDGTDCGFTATGDTQGANADLAALADVGAGVPLRVPNAGSAAVDDGGTMAAAIAGGGGALVALAALCGAGSLTRRRGLWRVPIAATVLSIAACGGGSGGSGPRTGTFVATLQDVTVQGRSSGRTLDQRTPGVEGATVTVAE